LDTNITNKYGTLLTPDIKLHRQWFKEMVKLHGINVIYRAVKPGMKYTTYAELDINFEPPSLEGCIFDEHPTQQTLKKIGWVSELQDSSSIIHVRYDLENIQQGCLFIIPSGLDDGKGRMFRVVKMTTGIIYPASITCEIVPEYENIFSPSLHDHQYTSFNLLNEEDDGFI
jgi:hypothetical protein